MAFDSIPDRRPHALCGDAEMTALHRALAHWNSRRLSPSAPNADWRADLEEE